MVSWIKTKLKSMGKSIKDPIDIYEAVQPLYLFCKVACLTPYSSKRLENGKVQYQLSWKQILLMLTEIVVYLLVVGLIIYYREFSESGTIEVRLQYIEGGLSGSLAAVEVIFASVFAKKMHQVFEGINEVEGNLLNLKVPVDYKNIYIQVVASLAICIGLSVYVVSFVVFFTAHMKLFRKLYLGCMFFIPYIVNVIVEIQYMICMKILTYRFHDLNVYLGSILKKKRKTPVVAWTVEQISTINKLKELEALKEADKQVLDEPVQIVDNVAALHIKLTDIATWVNTCFSVQLLLRITIAFIGIVTALFVIGSNFVNKTGDEDKTNVNVMFTTWAFSGALEVWLIVWVSCKVCEEATKCPRIMHRIRNNTKSIKLHDAIEHYSLQMYHNRLKFDVCGLFPLDYTLVYTIIAGVTTYLVILIQFNNSDYLRKTNQNATLNATLQLKS